jgi:hypothetical protein
MPLPLSVPVLDPAGDPVPLPLPLPLSVPVLGQAPDPVPATRSIVAFRPGPGPAPGLVLVPLRAPVSAGVPLSVSRETTVSVLALAPAARPSPARRTSFAVGIRTVRVPEEPGHR